MLVWTAQSFHKTQVKTLKYLSTLSEIFLISDMTCEDFSLLRAKYSIWTHISTHFLPLSLVLISAAHLVSLKGTIPFGNVGGFFSLSSSLATVKYV